MMEKAEKGDLEVGLDLGRPLVLAVEASRCVRVMTDLSDPMKGMHQASTMLL